MTTNSTHNNWRQGPQYYINTEDLFGRDYNVLNDHLRLRNVGFEDGGFIAANSVPYWDNGGRTNGEITALFAHSGSKSFVSRGWDGHLFQNFTVHPGEEIVFSGWMFTPSTDDPYDTNRVSGAMYGLLGLEFSAGFQQPLAKRDVRLTADYASGEWHYFAITSLVPDHAQSANATMRLDGFGAGHVYFDDLAITVSADTDRDGIPDWWEEQYDDVQDENDPSDSILDFDNDGLKNIDEYRRDANPALDDADGDGISDRWEIDWGFNPNDPSDAQHDDDFDGLTNLEEYERGTSPKDQDSDDDGLADGVEVNGSETSPLSDEFIGKKVVDVVNGSEATNTVGEWSVSGDHIYSEKRRGYAEYSISSSKGDMYRLEIDVTQNDPHAEAWNNLFSLLISVDGEFMGRQEVFVPFGSSGTAKALTPWLTPGFHSVRIFWDNIYYGTQVRIKELRLVELLAADSDSNGIKDWVQNILHNLNAVDIAPATSAVSPACIEGTGQHLSKIHVGNIGTPELPEPGVDTRWFADVPLYRTTEKTIVVSFENGAYVVTNKIRWIPTNLFNTNQILIRRGDALRLVAYPVGQTSGVSVINIEGVTSLVSSVKAPVVYEFTNAGIFTLTGINIHSNVLTSNIVTVTVIDGADPDEAPACWRYRTRTWDWSGASSQAVMQAKWPLQFIDQGQTNDGRRLELTLQDTDRPHYLISRLGTNGPVLTNVKVDGFWWKDGYNGVILYVGQVEGHALFEQRVATWEFPDSVEMKLNIFTSGVLFYPELALERTVIKDDLNEIGEYSYQFVVEGANATCHDTQASIRAPRTWAASILLVPR